jgi:molybdenum cofactor cytidylyltransferase
MISAIVLAAGRSRRMGTQKLLLPFQGTTLIGRVVDELSRSPLDQILVVVGRDGEHIAKAIPGPRVQFVTNPNDEAEMLSSVRCGLQALPAEASAVLVALGDQPGVTANVVRELVSAFHARKRGIVVPTHNGRRGHPLLFAAHYRHEILTKYEGCGLRGLLDAHPDDIFELEVASTGVLDDVDIPEDYQRVAER